MIPGTWFLDRFSARARECASGLGLKIVRLGSRVILTSPVRRNPRKAYGCRWSQGRAPWDGWWRQKKACVKTEEMEENKKKSIQKIRSRAQGFLALFTTTVGVRQALKPFDVPTRVSTACR